MSAGGRGAESCPFCEIVAGRAPARIVHESPHALAFLPLNPATPGHTLVVPRQHVRDLWQLTPETAHPVMDSVLLVARGIEAALSPEGLNLINSAGEAASQTVFHLHMHLVPRWTGDAMGPLWPTPRAADTEEQDRLAAALTEAIARTRSIPWTR
ncbi:HIT family protein [Streptomyces sp. NPDC049687]|uniref:HIT family protein n=1 Tax=Streptomyces sp. NPDC049687 TaxID=3365596 RepID=UPI0037ACC645